MDNNQDIEIDNLLDNNLFKPITDGLGFHHSIKKEKDVSISLKEKSLDLKADLENRAKQLNTTVKVNDLNETKFAKSKSMGELSAFYAEPTQESSLELEIEQETIIRTEASMGLRFAAWLTDSIIVVSMLAICSIGAVLASGVPFSYFSDNIYDLDISFFVATITILFYVFYFSFFDKTTFSTPGKRIFNLKVRSLDDKNISLVQASNRCLITLLSFITLGLGSMLKIQDRLTDTYVSQK